MKQTLVHSKDKGRPYYIGKPHVRRENEEMKTKKPYVRRVHSACKKNISKRVKIKTKDNQIYVGYI